MTTAQDAKSESSETNKLQIKLGRGLGRLIPIKPIAGKPSEDNTTLDKSGDVKSGDVKSGELKSVELNLVGSKLTELESKQAEIKPISSTPDVIPNSAVIRNAQFIDGNSMATNTTKPTREVSEIISEATIPVPNLVQSSKSNPQTTSQNKTQVQQVAQQLSTATRINFLPTATKESKSLANGFHPQEGRKIMQIALGLIVPNARQPRMEFDLKSIEELADSIRSAGLLQPVVVRPFTGDSTRFELIAGERRWRACKHLGWAEIPAIVTNATDQDAGIWALIENVHRTDLNPMDRALSLQKLASEFRLTHEALAEQLGLNRSSITNLLRLAELDETTASLVRKGHLTQGHAKALLGISNTKTRTTIAESAIRGDWSVRALEREVQRMNESTATVPRGTQAGRRRTNIDALERKLSQALGTDVKIQTGRKPNTGKLQIAFYSLEQFEGIVSAMGIKQTQMHIEN